MCITISIILTNSGTGYFLYMILFIFLLNKTKYIKYFIIPMFLLFIAYIIQTGLLNKVSLDYILFLFDFFVKIVDETYIKNVTCTLDIFLGINGNYEFPIDFGPMFLIAKVGLVYFILYSFVLIYMFKKSKCNYLRLSIIMLTIANVHYPALFFPIMNVLLPLLLIYILNKKKDLYYEKY